MKINKDKEMMMSRINDLKHHNNLIKKTFKGGSYASRTSRHATIQRFINALGAVRQVPPKWHALTKNNVISVVNYWKKSELKDTTIAIYISKLRSFLKVINHNIEGIDNKTIGLEYYNKNVNYPYQEEKFEAIYDPLIQQLFLLQIEFGLTCNESTNFSPDIHARNECLWLTREITRNSIDRVIKINNDKQKKIITLLSKQLKNCQCAKSQYGYDEIRIRYRMGLRSIGLDSTIDYRFIYTRKYYQDLLQVMSKKEAKLQIMDEMGISHVTLWRYLYEQN